MLRAINVWLCPVTDSVAVLTGGLLGSPNCMGRRMQTSMGCWDKPHCIVLDPMLLPDQTSCHIRGTMGALGTMSSPVCKLLLDVWPPWHYQGCYGFQTNGHFHMPHMGLVEFWSLLAR